MSHPILAVLISKGARDPGDDIVLANATVTAAGVGTQTAQLSLATDGGVTVQGSPDPGDWHVDAILAGLGTGWYVRWTYVSGDTASSISPVVNNWGEITTARFLTQVDTTSGDGSKSSTYDLDFSDDGGSTIAKTVQITVTATRVS